MSVPDGLLGRMRTTALALVSDTCAMNPSDVESEVSVRGETTDWLALDGGTVGVLVEGWDGHSEALDAQTAEDADDLRRAVSDNDLLLGEAEGARQRATRGDDWSMGTT